MNTELKQAIDNFVVEVNEYIKDQNERQGFTYRSESDAVSIAEGGRKYLKLVDGDSCWGFISLVDGVNKHSKVQKGDLLKPADWSSPARHSRGNILDGTASYGVYGPTYLK